MFYKWHMVFVSCLQTAWHMTFLAHFTLLLGCLWWSRPTRGVGASHMCPAGCLPSHPDHADPLGHTEDFSLPVTWVFCWQDQDHQGLCEDHLPFQHKNRHYTLKILLYFCPESGKVIWEATGSVALHYDGRNNNFSFPADALTANSMVVLKYLSRIIEFIRPVETQLQEISFSPSFLLI